MGSPFDDLAFIKTHTEIAASRLVPHISLYLASDITPLWQASETYLAGFNIAPPFWAFAWPGSEVLARYIMDHPELVAGRRVLDFAAGSGLAAIAAAWAGADSVLAVDIDPLAAAAIALNAALNAVQVSAEARDIVGAPCGWDVILCGDICYEAPMTRHIMPWLRRCAESALVLLADPGRRYAPSAGLEVWTRMTVPVSRELEDSETREVTLYRVKEESSFL